MIKEKHTPLRRCIACRMSLPQDQLIRFYLSEDNWHLDQYRLAPKGRNHFSKPSGRGAWLCLKPKCHTLKKLKFFKGQAEEICVILENLSSET